MENVVASIAQKKDLITLDLLGPNPSSKALDPPLQISSNDNDLPRLDLNRALDDDAPRPAALPGCQSVCTIEKVKRALERETKRQKGGGGGSASTSASPSPSSSSSSVTTASIRRRADRGDERSAADGGDGDSATTDSRSLVVAGCPGCLSYVLIPKGNPRCPRCDARLAAASVLAPLPPPPPPPKKPRVDLNYSLSTL